MKLLTTTDAVIDAFGGAKRMAQFLTAQGYPCGKSAATNWTTGQRGKFPPETVFILQAALAQRGLTAPASLWGIPLPAEKEPA